MRAGVERGRRRFKEGEACGCDVVCVISGWGRCVGNGGGDWIVFVFLGAF